MLTLHRDYVNLIYYTILQRNPGFSTSRLVFNPFEDSQCYGRRMRNHMKDLNLNLSNVITVGTPQFSSWTNLVKLDFQALEKVWDPDVVYIDGSKSENGVFAAVSRRKTAVGSLSSVASIFTAGLHAILAAVKMTRDFRNHSVVICRYSHSALQAIKSL